MLNERERIRVEAMNARVAVEALKRELLPKGKTPPLFTLPEQYSATHPHIRELQRLPGVEAWMYPAGGSTMGLVEVWALIKECHSFRDDRELFEQHTKFQLESGMGDVLFAYYEQHKDAIEDEIRQQSVADIICNEKEEARIEEGAYRVLRALKPRRRMEYLAQTQAHPNDHSYLDLFKIFCSIAIGAIFVTCGALNAQLSVPYARAVARVWGREFPGILVVPLLQGHQDEAVAKPMADWLKSGGPELLRGRALRLPKSIYKGKFPPSIGGRQDDEY